MTVLRNTIHTARKFYPRDACRHWNDAGYGEHYVGADDWLIVQGAKSDKWKIKPGDKYRKIVYVDGGDIVTYRGRLDMDSLCQRHGVFDDC